MGKERHFILIKEKIHQNNLSILIINVPNTRAPIFVKVMLLTLKTYLGDEKIVLGDFKTSFSPRYRSLKQKLNRDIVKLT